MPAPQQEVQTPTIRDISSVTDDPDTGLRFIKNVSVPLRSSRLPIRANVYLPLTKKASDTTAATFDPSARFPGLVTYGPYGKDIPYATFYPASFAEVNPDHRSPYSAWETPDPGYWRAATATQ